MTTAAGLPLPKLSRGRFVWTIATQPDGPISDVITAYTDEALLDACGVRIFFTERSGGTSVGPFASFDLGSPTPENDPEVYKQACAGGTDYFECVNLNRAALVNVAGISDTQDCHLVCPKQVHGDTIVVQRGTSSQEVDEAQNAAKAGADAVMVLCTQVAALLRFADCLPLILVAPGGVFSVVHCGWKGTIAHLAAKAAYALASEAACAPSQINAYIGAYIHRECFEVEEDLAKRFSQEFAPGVSSYNAATATWHVDLGASVAHDLLGCGLVAPRIVDIDKCTVCNNEEFFSYRAQDGICGRHGAFAVRLS